MSGVTVYPEASDSDSVDTGLLGFTQIYRGVYDTSPTIDTNSVIYTVPANTYAIVDSITIHLTTPSYSVDYDDGVWLLWQDDSGSQDIWLLYDFEMGHNNTFQMNLNLKLDAGDKLVGGNIEDTATVNSITETPFNIWVAGREFDV